MIENFQFIFSLYPLLLLKSVVKCASLLQKFSGTGTIKRYGHRCSLQASSSLQPYWLSCFPHTLHSFTKILKYTAFVKYTTFHLSYCQSLLLDCEIPKLKKESYLFIFYPQNLELFHAY